MPQAQAVALVFLGMRAGFLLVAKVILLVMDLIRVAVFLVVAAVGAMRELRLALAVSAA
jgi:hypothetical protein